MYQRILVPVDGSPTSNRGLGEAIALGKLTGARLRLIHVVDELSFAISFDVVGSYAGDVLSLLRENGETILAKARSQVEAAGIGVDSELRESFGGRVSDFIVAEAANWPADLIVMGTHGRRGMRHLTLGSDAERVVRTAAVPVLLVRDAGGE